MYLIMQMQEYLLRLADEANLIELTDAIFRYYVRVGGHKSAASVALMHLEHIYYKHNTMAVAVHRSHVFNKTYGRHKDLHPGCLGKIEAIKRDSAKVHPASFLGNPSVQVDDFVDPTQKVEELCHFIFKHGDERPKTRALLCAVFHNALHDRYHRARDMFLISHVQDNVDKIDTTTQILYNRALVTLGLSAFRQGLIQKAHDCLSGVCSSRVKVEATINNIHPLKFLPIHLFISIENYLLDFWVIYYVFVL